MAKDKPLKDQNASILQQLIAKLDQFKKQFIMHALAEGPYITNSGGVWENQREDSETNTGTLEVRYVGA